MTAVPLFLNRQSSLALLLTATAFAGVRINEIQSSNTVTIQPDQYLLVWASNKNRPNGP
jgi:hypothetical protein